MNVIATNETVLPEEAAPKITSGSIKVGIRASRGAGYQTFFEVGNDTGTRVNRHADAVSIGIWPSTGHQIHGFEVKVSRADFLGEMKDPAKSQAIFRFCHRWSLATPPGLVKVDELPPNWGLVTWDGRGMRTIKHAPLLVPEPIAPGFMAALVRRAGELDDEIITAAVLKAKVEWKTQADASLDRELAARKEGATGEARAALSIVAQLKTLLGADYLHDFEIPEIVAALKIVRKMKITGDRYGGLATLLTDLEDVRSRAKEIIDRVVKVGADNGIQIERRRK